MNTVLLREKLTKLITPYVPATTVQIVVNWIIDYKIVLTITQKRNSLLGDYRHPYDKSGHRISVNGDLNKYAFLITFIHEMAHLMCWEQYGAKVKSHGSEWKMLYSFLLKDFFAQNIFPEQLIQPLKRYTGDLSASTCNDPHLMKALRQFDKKINLILEEIPKDHLFKTHDGRVFKKGERVRVRYKCLEVKTNRIYLFHPAHEVKKVEN
jgi:SprT protein